jgi:hypothetical protein
MHKGKILLVSEQPITEVAAFLERLGYAVKVAHDVASAALSALEQRPDAVVWVGMMGEEWQELKSVLADRFKILEVEEIQGLLAKNGHHSNDPISWEEEGRGRSGNGQVISSLVSELASSGATQEVLASAGDIEDGQGPWKVLGMEDLACLLEKQVRAGTPRLQHFYTKVGNKLRRVEVKDIRYIEVEGKYSAIHVAERKYNVKASLKDLLHKLPEQLFVRVSRNYVVNVDRIEHIDTFQYTVRIGELEIPISRTYKENLMQFIQLL